MSAPQSTNGMSDDGIILLFAAILAGPFLLAILAASVPDVGTWLITHKILVAPEAHPLWALPGCGGAGVDLGRIALAGGLVLAAAALLIGATWRRVQGPR